VPRRSWQNESNKSHTCGGLNSPHRSRAVAVPVIEETIELPNVAQPHGCVSLVLKRRYRFRDSSTPASVGRFRVCLHGGCSVNLITSGELNSGQFDHL
jgi:hypothetical protein